LEEAKGRKDVYRGENRGVEARRRRDEEGKEEAKEEGREDAAERMLGRKEQEYARLVEEGKEGGEEEAVVDFARKKREREGEGEGGREGGRYVWEAMDEFGRTRVMSAEGEKIGSCKRGRGEGQAKHAWGGREGGREGVRKRGRGRDVS
jgi:hypothetical protein